MSFVSRFRLSEVFGLVIALVSYIGLDISQHLSPCEDPSALQILQSYLQIRTDHPEPAYYEAINFLDGICHELNLTTSQLEFVPNKPLLLATIPGKDPSLPSVIFNSHTDVVPAEPSKWLSNADPFQANVIFKGGERRIYARGSQDMKSVGVQYLLAARNLLRHGWQPQRSLHILFVPDEEIGGEAGMGKFVESDIFKKLNVAFEVDEGLPTEENYFRVFYGERQPWWLSIKVEQQPGHGALLPEMTAPMKIHSIIDKALTFRRAQFEKVAKGDAELGDVCGVNIVYMKTGTRNDRFSSGFIMNLIPSMAEAGLDIRVPPTIASSDMDAEIKKWLMCADGKLCPGVKYEFSHKVDVASVTDIDPGKNDFVRRFYDALRETGATVKESIFPAATDARFFRKLKIPSLGFSPIRLTPNLLHDHNEYVPEHIFLQGVTMYESLFRHLGASSEIPTRSDKVEL